MSLNQEFNITSLDSESDHQIDDFFAEYEQRIENFFSDLGSDTKRVCENESDEFLKQRDELLKKFENHLIKSSDQLKNLENTVNLRETLDSKIEKLIKEEEQVNKDLEELLATKENLREMLDTKSNMVKETIKKKKEVERICNGTVKDEFVSLCKFMNLKFQWEKEVDKTKEKEKKFSIIFLSDSSEFTQVKKVEIEKLLNKDEQYLKKLRDQFKIQVQQIIK